MANSGGETAFALMLGLSASLGAAVFGMYTFLKKDDDDDDNNNSSGSSVVVQADGTVKLK
jgi:hypothetical protein